jgi:outer membrane protein W
MKLHLVLAGFVCLFAAASLSAQSTSATLYLSAQVNDDDSRFSDDPDVFAGFDTGGGFGLSLSRMFGRNLSGELAVFRLSSSGEIREEGTGMSLDLGDLELTPIVGMLRYHFRPGQRVDVYAGAGLARVLADDLDTADLRAEGLAPIEIEDETAAVAGLGVIVSVSPRWSVVFDARYLPLDVTGRTGGQSESVDLNPLILSAGVRIGF